MRLPPWLLPVPGSFHAPGNNRPVVSLELEVRPLLTRELIDEQVHRITEQLDPGGEYRCPVEGCGYRLVVDVPEVEPPMHLNLDGCTASITWRGVARGDVEARLAQHAEGHAATSETGLDVAAVLDPDEFTRWDA